MKRHHPSEQQEQAFSDDPCIQTCDCPLKSEYDSSHDSSDDSFHFEYESFSKRSKFCNGQDEVAVKVELKTEQLKMENDADDYDDDSLNNNLRGEVDADGMYAFCCCNCSCLENERKHHLFSLVNNCGNTSGDNGCGNAKLYHRACCHNVRKEEGADYLSPVQVAVDEALASMGVESAEKAKPISHIISKYKQGRRDATKYENEEWDEAKDCSIYSNPVYIQCCKDFQQRIKGSKRKIPLRVLDLFCGIGSGTVVLKKLKIPLGTVVHVEHDPVAVEVSKFHHKNDDIRHVYLDTFEEVYGSGEDPDEEILNWVIENYGPFDLVLAAAPCQNYSQVNAYKSKKKESAKYLLKVGFLIEAINKLQRNGHGVTRDVLFLSENVVFREDLKLRINSLEAINKSYRAIDGCGLQPIQLDAKDFSPCKRNRFYWCNIPVRSIEGIKNVASHVSADVCLDEGFLMSERVLELEGFHEYARAVVKANAFMASSSRINDNRMIKIKNEEGRYYIHTYSVREREKMLGLPLGYVEDATNNLFRSLTGDAFLKPETMEGTSHRNFLDQSFWHFRKKCYFKIKPRFNEPPFFQIEISAPLEGKQKLEYFDEDSYCKHLLGNGWSLPVVEHLLEPLQELFDKEDLKTYPLYDYSYPWEPYASNGRTEVSVPEVEL